MQVLDGKEGLIYSMVDIIRISVDVFKTIMFSFEVPVLLIFFINPSFFILNMRVSETSMFH